jgi:hypothetical protein
VLGEVVDRGALGEVLAELVEAPGGLQALAQLLGRRALAGRGGLQRGQQVAVRGLDVLGLDDGRDDCLAAQRLLGVGLGLLEDLLLGLAGDLQVGVLRDPLVAE